MSLENNLKRIADALELIAAQMDGAKASPAPVAQESIKPATTHETAPDVAPQAPAEAVPTAVVPPAPTATTAPAAMSPEELNAILVQEFQRIGNREPIDAAMAELGVTSVTDLPADKQHELVNKVRAIQA